MYLLAIVGHSLLNSEMIELSLFFSVRSIKMPCSEIYFLQERVVICFLGEKVNDIGKDFLLQLMHHPVFAVHSH